ncbi:hypothetical protein [Bacillus sp. NPDC077027]|uniref:hypothetical protein n=1 Tax=Bacillus sp. NPDC077027 TaxID=3390548 RepID=UPI003D09336F
MKTMVKGLILTTSLTFFATPLASTAAAQTAPAPIEQVQTTGDFSIPSVTDTIKNNLNRVLENKDELFNKIEIFAGKEKRDQIEELYNQHLHADLQGLLEQETLSWKKVDTTIYNSFKQAGVPFLIAKSLSHFATLAVKKM